MAHSRRSLERRRTPYGSPISGTSSAGPGTGTSRHIASSHDDTTEGAIHYFQDELGNWHSYTFSEGGGGTGGSGTVMPLRDNLPASSYTHIPKLSQSIGDSSCEQASLSTTAEPRQGTSTNWHTNETSGASGQLGQMTMGRALTSCLKSPSSSESWSSESSTELAVDTNTNKTYASYRRNLPIVSSSQANQAHSLSASGGPSPISMPSLTPESTASASASAHATTSGRLPVPSYSSMHRQWQRNRREVLQVLTESLLERRRMPGGAYSTGSGPNDTVVNNVEPDSQVSNSRSLGQGHSDRDNLKRKRKKHTRYYYEMKIFPFISKFSIKVWFDRLKLMTLFDRHRTFFENLLAIVLALGVASLGSYLLHQGYYQDLTMVLLCFVMASCQFSGKILTFIVAYVYDLFYQC